MPTLPRLVALALAGGALMACGDAAPEAADPTPSPSASRTPTASATPAAVPTRLSIVDPTKGQTLRDAITVTGSAPHAGDDVVCGLDTEGGNRASRGTAVVGEQADEPYAWTVRVDLTDVVPGSYQLRCTTGGRQDGSEEALARYDSRDVVVAEPSTPPDPPAGDPPRPVFYVGDTISGPRLFQSLVPNDTGEPDHGSGILVGHLMSTPPDPDYRTLWAPGSLVNLGREIGDGRLALELSDAGIRSLEAMTAVEAALAVQQVAYSFGGEVAQLVDEEGREVRPVEKAPELEVRSLVNLDYPAEGQVVRDRFVVRGLASSFEGTVGWEIRREGGRVVLRGSGQASGDLYRLSPWEQTIDVSLLRPGRYLYVAMTDDPSGEGRFHTDTRTLLIK